MTLKSTTKYKYIIKKFHHYLYINFNANFKRDFFETHFSELATTVAFRYSLPCYVHYRFSVLGMNIGTRLTIERKSFQILRIYKINIPLSSELKLS